MQRHLERYIYVVILFIGFVDYLGIGLVYPILAALLFDSGSPFLEASASASTRGVLFGVLVALAPLGQFIFAPLLGTFSDRYGRKPALFLGMGTGFVGYLLALVSLYTHSLSLLFIYRICVGVSEGTSAVASATVVDISTEENKAGRFSLLNSCFGIGFTVGPFLGGFLASLYGFYAPFIAAGSMCLINLVLLSTKFPETRQPNQKKEERGSPLSAILQVTKVFTMREFSWLFTGGFCLSFGWSLFGEFSPLFLRERFQASIHEIGNFYAWCGGWYAFFAFVASTAFVQQFKPENYSTFFMGLGGLVLLTVSQCTYIEAVWASIVLMMALLASLYPVIAAHISNRASDDRQGEVMGVYQSIQSLAMATSPLAFGSVIGMYPSGAAWIGACFFIVGSLALFQERAQGQKVLN